MPISAYSPIRDNNASITPGDIRSPDFAKDQQIINSIRQLMADLAGLGITPFVESLLNDPDAATFLGTLGVSGFIQTLLDDANAAAALATLGIVAGTYTPTLSNISNVAASTAFLVPYLRVGALVIVGVYVSIDPNLAAPTLTTMGITLPVASAFTASDEAMGSGLSLVATNSSDRIIAVAASGVRLDFQAGSAAAATHTGMFIYRII